MVSNKYNVYLGLSLALLFFGKLAFSFSTNEHLSFMLKPLSMIVGTVFNASHSLNQHGAYTFEQLDIVITQACSGINYLLICFIMLQFLRSPKLRGHKAQITCLFSTLAISYVYTLLVNSSRIACSVWVQSSPLAQLDWMHKSLGAFIYLSFLIALYLSVNLIMQKKEAAS